MNKAKLYTRLGVVLMAGGTVLAVVVTCKKKPKIDYILRRYKEDKTLDKKNLVKDVAKEAVPAAAPVVLMEAAGAYLIFKGEKKLVQGAAALSTAYAISEAALKRYKENVVEAIGEKKERDIHDKTVQDICDERSLPENQVVFTGYGDTLCKDLLSGQEFMSDIEKIRSARNEFNDFLNHEDFASLNDCYDFIGIEKNDIGEMLGWNRDRDGLVGINYSSVLVRGKPCLAIEFDPAPRYNFDKFGQ